MLKKMIYKIKQQQSQKQIERDLYVIGKQEEAEQRNQKSDNKMMSKWCPIIDRHCIGHDCVHFSSANYQYYNDGELFIGIFGQGAKCKLWGIYGR